MRIDHKLTEKLRIARNQEKSVKTSVFNKLEQLWGLNTGISFSEIKRAYNGGTSLSWHLYGNTGYFKIPGRDGRYLHKVAYGVWELRGQRKNRMWAV